MYGKSMFLPFCTAPQIRIKTSKGGGKHCFWVVLVSFFAVLLAVFFVVLLAVFFVVLQFLVACTFGVFYSVLGVLNFLK